MLRVLAAKWTPPWAAPPSLTSKWTGATHSSSVGWRLTTLESSFGQSSPGKATNRNNKPSHPNRFQSLFANCVNFDEERCWGSKIVRITVKKRNNYLTLTYSTPPTPCPVFDSTGGGETVVKCAGMAQTAKIALQPDVNTGASNPSISSVEGRAMVPRYTGTLNDRLACLFATKSQTVCYIIKLVKCSE